MTPLYALRRKRLRREARNRIRHVIVSTALSAGPVFAMCAMESKNHYTRRFAYKRLCALHKTYVGQVTDLANASWETAATLCLASDTQEFAGRE